MDRSRGGEPTPVLRRRRPRCTILPIRSHPATPRSNRKMMTKLHRLCLAALLLLQGRTASGIDARIVPSFLAAEALIDAVSSPLGGSKVAKRDRPYGAANATEVNVFERIARAAHETGDGATSGALHSNVDQSRSAPAPIEAQRAKAGFRYVEDVAPGLRLDMDLHSILHASTSAVQSVQVVDTYFGRTLVTDGKTQSAEHDEFVYHESLVHPAMFWSALLGREEEEEDGPPDKWGAPRSVFIGGGGELATAREVLRHSTVERVVMVDIDPEVIEVSKKYLPEWGGEAVASHPKVEHIVGDVAHYLAGSSEKFDVMIIDVSDPIEAGPAVALYTQEFYETVSGHLNEHGVFVTQAGSASFIPFPHSSLEGSCFGPIKNTLAAVFDHAVPYSAPVASFGEDWGFVLAFNGRKGEARRLVDLPCESIDDLIEGRIETVPGVPEHKIRSFGVNRAVTGDEGGSDVLKHYDGTVHRRLFALSKPLRTAMRIDDRVMTEANPIFMY